ncbi:hypothetical protein P12x_005330 [Tundrisphaera lichenicola]|uniref:hypothetical protein n=1 Tax=Tundrisphaera lichenicola TaxID=2029860 RepID=UPI003EBD4C13
MKNQFVDAQEMNRKHPTTFEVPSDAELAAIKAGDSVKVCTCDERFWVTVTEVSEHRIAGTVDNDLIFTDEHGLDYGDVVRFTRENVYSIIAKATGKEAA